MTSASGIPPVVRADTGTCTASTPTFLVTVPPTTTPLRGTCDQIFRVVGIRPLRIIQKQTAVR